MTLSFPDDCRYADSHEFARADGDLVRVGISAYAVDQLGDIVFVDLPSAADKGFRPGMYAHGEFRIGVSTGLLIPRSAILFRDGYSFVFRVVGTEGEFGRVEEIKIELGRSVGEMLEVSEGLVAEDHLVRAGAAFLADGDRVRILP